MILVTGATGNLGQSVVRQLQQKANGRRFAALARNPEKAKPLRDAGVEVRAGDFDDAASLSKAFAGVEKLLLISTMDMNRLAQHARVIDAAKAAGVRHIVYTGLAIRNIETSGVRQLMESHFQTEQHLKASGLAYTMVRNSMYAEAIPMILGPGFPQHGMALSGGSGRVPYALRAEMGEGIANLLLEPGHANTTYQFGGSEAHSYADIAQEASNLFKQPVTYQDISPEQYQQQLKQAGMDDFGIYLTHGTVMDIHNHQYEVDSTDLERFLGRKPASLGTMLRTVFNPTR